MLALELEKKKSVYRENLLLEQEATKAHMESDPVKKLIERDAKVIWKAVQSRFMSMPPAESYEMYVGCEYKMENVVPYYAIGKMWPKRLFKNNFKVRYPNETFKVLREIAEKEGIEASNYQMLKPRVFSKVLITVGLIFKY